MSAPPKRWFRSQMKIEVHGDINCQVYGIEYRPLYDCLLQLSGAVFPREPRHFWTGAGIYAEFVLRGYIFQVEGDPFDDALWISPKDGLAHPEEMREIREHIERYSKA